MAKMMVSWLEFDYQKRFFVKELHNLACLDALAKSYRHAYLFDLGKLEILREEGDVRTGPYLVEYDFEFSDTGKVVAVFFKTTRKGA